MSGHSDHTHYSPSFITVLSVAVLLVHPPRRPPSSDKQTTCLRGKMSVEVKYDFMPHDGTPGKPYDDFEDRLLNYSASEVDDRGWSHADHFQGIDEGGPLGPAMPAPGTADNGRKALNARRKREKSRVFQVQ